MGSSHSVFNENVGLLGSCVDYPCIDTALVRSSCSVPKM